jgi:hypothetical protein
MSLHTPVPRLGEAPTNVSSFSFGALERTKCQNHRAGVPRDRPDTDRAHVRDAVSDVTARSAAAEDAGRKAREHGMEVLDIMVSGPGSGRESALRALQAVGFQVTAIRDVTPIPHNGCRPRKRRRV